MKEPRRERGGGWGRGGRGKQGWNRVGTRILSREPVQFSEPTGKPVSGRVSRRAASRIVDNGRKNRRGSLPSLSLHLVFLFSRLPGDRRSGLVIIRRRGENSIPRQVDSPSPDDSSALFRRD